ncbi:hypothetical protein [Methylophilus sp.]|uniref:hypothetical protein n=1 Tax=Methylophilus sp. TaxID=29541 RepID=UPI000D4409B9|nr:hypothetical protein [Methylophilus sp.]PPD10525.1 MAG: hypothetical protein CTY26_13260 [Methylophilus sp.]
MGTLTIRTDKQDEAAIEELKALFGEASASKAILQAVRRFKRLKESDEDFSRRLKRAEEKLNRVKSHYSSMMEHKLIVEEELGLDHKE